MMVINYPCLARAGARHCMPAVSHSVGAVPCCNMAIFISGEVVKSVASMKDVVDVVEKGLLAFSTGGVVQPVRSVVPVAEHGGYVVSCCL